jgi:hypothetical protein
MLRRKLYLLSVVFFFWRGDPLPAVVLAGRSQRGSLRGTILFVAVSAAPGKLATDWAEDCDEIILRRCPIRERDSIIGLALRRKQAHNERHDWIWIHRGRCGR